MVAKAIRSVTAAATLCAVGLPAFAHGEDATWDIAGASLSMTPEEVESTLSADGWVLDSTIRSGRSWRDEVNHRLANVGRADRRRLDDASIRRQFFEKGASRLVVEYWAVPSGDSEAYEIEYRIPPAAMGKDTFASSVASKYGSPSKKNAFDYVYCSDGESACTANLITGKPFEPYLHASLYENSVVMTYGRRHKEERAEAIREDMDTTAPAVDVEF